MPQPNDPSKSLAALDQDSTIIAVVEMSLMTWLVAGIVPGVNRQPLKKLAADDRRCSRCCHRWRDEAIKAGHPSIGSRWPTKPVGTAFGWRGGCENGASRLM